jgi:hypothetical protein
VLISLLAIGSGRAPSSVFYSWKRERGSYGGETLVESWWGSLFTHFFAQCWVDFRNLGPDSTGTDWFANSAAAARANRRFCMDRASSHRTYGELRWGLTSCFGPGGYNGGRPQSYGAEPLGDPSPALPNHDGTVAPYGAGSCVSYFDPDPAVNPVVLGLRHLFDDFPGLWGLYGFEDSFNLGASGSDADDWYADDYVGIDSGPLLVALENFRSGLVWERVGRNAGIRRCLGMLFKQSPVRPGEPEAPETFRLEGAYPNPFNAGVRVRFFAPAAGRAVLRLFDMKGREALRPLETGAAAGSNEALLPSASLVSGVYFVRVEAFGSVRSRKIACVR